MLIEKYRLVMDYAIHYRAYPHLPVSAAMFNDMVRLLLDWDVSEMTWSEIIRSCRHKLEELENA